MDLVLEERLVKQFVVAILERDAGLLPDHLVAERNVRVQFELLLVLADQIDVHNAVFVPADLELLVRPQIVAATVALLADHRP